MKIHRMAQVAFVALLPLLGFTTAGLADTGTVSVVFTKGGFIVDVGGG
jgi:energy-converting hydrogenase Eha subunit H